MNCPYCGAAMRHDEIKCSYCGHENEALARQAHEEEIREIREDAQELYCQPVRQERHASRWLHKIALAAILLFAAAALCAFAWSLVRPHWELHRQNENLKTLEALYQSGDYSALYQKLDGIEDRYRAVYDKYTTVGDMQQDLDRVREELPETVELVRDYPPAADLFAYDLERLFSVLTGCEDLASAGYVYGEGAAVESLSQQAMAILANDLLLTDPEIRQGLTLSRTEDPDYTDLYTRIAERLQGGQP